ncbi:MAG: GNAT family N-acetyltransferase [Bacilli bacterium]
MTLRKGNNSFYIGDDELEPVAIINYVTAGDKRLIIDSTYVSETLRGQGIGELLLDEVVKLARKNKKIVIPLCPFAKHIMSKTNKYNDVLE